MATEKWPSGADLGPVLETYGGKSFKRIVAAAVTIFGCGLTTAILIRVFRPDQFGPIICAFVFGLGIALGYVSTNLDAALAKVEVCAGGLRLTRRAGVAWDLKGYLAGWSGMCIVELPWDRILKVNVGRFRNIRWRPAHVVIRTKDGKDIEFPFHFWSAVGTERFATTVQRFVKDVDVDVDFDLEFVSGLWRGVIAEPDAAELRVRRAPGEKCP